MFKNKCKKLKLASSDSNPIKEISKRQCAMKLDQLFHRFVPIDRHYKKAFGPLQMVMAEAVTKIDLNRDAFVHPSLEHNIRQYQRVDRVPFE